MVCIRQRWSVVMLGAVLGLGLAACKKDETASGDKGGNAASSGATAKADDLSLLPGDSEVVGGINFGQMQQSPVWSTVIQPKMAAGQRKLEEFKAKCGIDPMKMVSSIAFGAKGMSGDKPSVVVVAHGVDKAKVLDCIDKNKDELAKDGSQVTRDGDFVLLKDRRGESGTLGFIDASTAILVVGENGTPAGVKAAIGGKNSLKDSAAFLDMYKKVSTTDSLWMMASGKMVEQLPLLGGAVAAYGSLNLTNGVSLDGRIKFDKPDVATQAASMLNAQAKQAAAFVDKAEFTSDGTEVHGSVVISGQKLTQLTPFLGMAMPGMGGN
jgi:hypothetical protein